LKDQSTLLFGYRVSRRRQLAIEGPMHPQQPTATEPSRVVAKFYDRPVHFLTFSEGEKMF